MKLLVTGGAGFIGSNFILYWIKNHPSDTIINFDKLTYSGNLENLKSIQDNLNYSFIQGDICDLEMVNKAMQGIDTVVHFAAESHVDRSIIVPEVFVKTNVLGTQVLLESARKNNVKRFHHISCYDDKTRAYTRQGLKYYWELTTDDEVLSLNQDTKEIEWKKIAKVIVQDYSGEMINMRSTRVNFKVTPNHRMLFETNRAGRLLFREARKLASVNILPKGKWKGRYKLNSNFMYLLGVFIGNGIVVYHDKILANKSGYSKAEYLHAGRDKVTGLFITPIIIGNPQNRTSYSYRIFLDVPVKDKGRQRLEETLTELNINWRVHSGKAGEHIYFSLKKLGDIFMDCGRGALNKTIPDWILDADQESLRALFDGLIDAYGHWVSGRGNSQNARFYTSSLRLVENFAELCIKLGFIPHVSKRESKENYFEGRLIKGKNSYIVTVSTVNRSIRTEKKLHQISLTQCKGKIWCVKVPENNNFLVEREGVFAFCGNTDEVFGSLELEEKSKFSERTLYDPRSPYSASKAGSDHLARAYHYTYGLPVTITNCSNNFGPYQFPEKFISLAITNLMEDKKVPIYGDGLNIRDWLYVEDHCRAIDLVLAEGKVGETYLVGGMSELISNIEIVRKILRLMGKDESHIEFVKDRPGHDRKYNVDWSKINKELGWEPKYSFSAYLEKTVEWYKEHKDWWKNVKSGDYQQYYTQQYEK